MLMNMKVQQTPILVLLAISLYWPAATSAAGQWQGFSRPVLSERTAANSAPRISADEAAAKVQREYGGRILAVETLQQNGLTVYRIKVLTRKGVVRVVRIDAGSRR